MLKSNKKLSDYNNSSRLVSNKKLKSKSVIKKVSKTGKERNKKYIVLAEQYLKRNPICERCNSEPASEIHHKNGRIGNNLYNYFMAVSRCCHLYIHDNPAESYEKGWLLKL